MDWQKILKVYMEQVYQAEGSYACHVPFSGPVDKKLSKEERVALMAINKELTRTHDRWLSIEDNPPTKIGWYAVIRRFRDRPDRFPVGSGYWDGTGWDHGHIFARSPQVFANENVAEAWAFMYQQAWEPFGIPASICYNASEGSFALKGDKNVAKKEERTHAGS